MQNKDPYEIIHKIQSLFQKYYGPHENYSSLLNQVLSIEGIGPYLKKMSKLKKDEMEDAISELRFASLFSLCGFQVLRFPESKIENEPRPDFKIIKNSKIGFVEVKHKRLIIGISDEKADDGYLHQYGDFTKSEESIRQKVVEALTQLHGYFQKNKCDFFVIAIWSSNDNIDELDAHFSAPSIISDEITGLNRYTTDILLIYGSNWRYKTFFHAIQLCRKTNVINPELIQQIEEKSIDEIFGIHRISFLEWLKLKNIE